jgi:hypothetical protein
MVKIPGANLTGPSGRADKTGAAPKNAPPGESPGTGKAVPPQGASKIPPIRPAGLQAPVQKTLSGLAQVLGLPKDALSASIISFARYFSLPLDPGLMAKIRRDSLSAAPEASAPAKAPPPEGRDGQSAAALASAAAAAKGLELSRGGLAAYAAALDPGSPDKNSGDPGQSGHGDTGHSPGDGDTGRGSSGHGDAGHSPGGGASGNSGQRGGSQDGLDPGDLTQGDKLREKLLNIEGQNPLLNLLNRVPGRNGERWITIPFAFTHENLEYRVSLRILVEETSSRSLPGRESPGRLALDISGGDRDRPVLRWFFMYDKPLGEEPRLKARFWPPEDKKTQKSFQKKLSLLLSLHSDQIEIINDKNLPSFAIDCRDSILPSIDEEV